MAKGDERKTAAPARRKEEDDEDDEEDEKDDEEEEKDDEEDEEDEEDDEEDEEDDEENVDEDDEEDDDEDDGDDEEEGIDGLRRAHGTATTDDGAVVSGATGDDGRRKRPKKVKATLTPEQLAEYQAKIACTGVVYLSRIPPFMKPQKLRQLLSKYAEVDRIYLAPEDPKVRARRIRYGGNRKDNYTEGWVEFKDKRLAKRVAGTLNGTIIGGKKRNFYHDDLWTLKYLPKFKWQHLTERVAYEKAARQQRLRTELSQSKRENAFYLQNVEKARVLEIVADRKRKRADDAGEGGDSSASAPTRARTVAKVGDTAQRSEAAAAAAAARFEQAKAKFRQREPILNEGSDPVPTVAAKHSVGPGRTRDQLFSASRR